MCVPASTLVSGRIETRGIISLKHLNPAQATDNVSPVPSVSNEKVILKRGTRGKLQDSEELPGPPWARTMCKSSLVVPLTWKDKAGTPGRQRSPSAGQTQRRVLHRKRTPKPWEKLLTPSTDKSMAQHRLRKPPKKGGGQL